MYPQIFLYLSLIYLYHLYYLYYIYLERDHGETYIFHPSINVGTLHGAIGHAMARINMLETKKPNVVAKKTKARNAI